MGFLFCMCGFQTEVIGFRRVGTDMLRRHADGGDDDGTGQGDSRLLFNRRDSIM